MGLLIDIGCEGEVPVLEVVGPEFTVDGVMLIIGLDNDRPPPRVEMEGSDIEGEVVFFLRDDLE